MISYLLLKIKEKYFQTCFSKIFNEGFEFNEEDPFLDPVGLESGLTMVKKKQKRTLTLDEKIKAVLNEDTLKQVKQVKPEEHKENLRIIKILKTHQNF